MSHAIHALGPIEAGQDGELYSKSKHQSVAMVLLSEEGEAIAPLLAAAYNAFDSAAKALNVNAIELAERMQDGGIAELLRVILSLRAICGRQANMLSTATDAERRDFIRRVYELVNGEGNTAIAKTFGDGA
jgi:hypothetical protein